MITWRVSQDDHSPIIRLEPFLLCLRWQLACEVDYRPLSRSIRAENVAHHTWWKIKFQWNLTCTSWWLEYLVRLPWSHFSYCNFLCVNREVVQNIDLGSKFEFRIQITSEFPIIFHSNELNPTSNFTVLPYSLIETRSIISVRLTQFQLLHRFRNRTNFSLRSTVSLEDFHKHRRRNKYKSRCVRPSPFACLTLDDMNERVFTKAALVLVKAFK